MNQNIDIRLITTELKRYDIKPDQWEEFLAVWRRIVMVRRRLGFEVLFALVDRQKNVFTWAIAHKGNFDEAAKLYYEDPERVALDIVNKYVTAWEISRLSQEPLPDGPVGAKLPI